MEFLYDTQIKNIIINNIFDLSTDSSKENLVEIGKFIQKSKTQKLIKPSVIKDYKNTKKSHFIEFIKNCNKKSLPSVFIKNINN